MIDYIEIRLTKCGVNYTLTPSTDYFNDGFAYDFASLIAEVVKMTNVNPTIVIEQIKEICELGNNDNNER